MGAPCSPRSLISAFVANIMLELMSASLTIPSAVIDCDTNPRILFGACSVTDSYSLGSRIAVLIRGLIYVTGSRNFLAHTCLRLTNTFKLHVKYICVRVVRDVAHQSRSTPHSKSLHVDQTTFTVSAESRKASLLLTSFPIDGLASVEYLDASSIAILTLSQVTTCARNHRLYGG